MGYASSNLALSTIFWQCSIAANAAPSYGEDRVFESHHCYHICCGGRKVMQESAKLFYAGASPVRNSISGQWHSWLAQTLDKRQVEGSSPSCPTIAVVAQSDSARDF
jgi:hypothetical protein